MLSRNEFHRIITEAERKLKEAGIASPQAEVEIILEHLLDVDRLNVYLHGAELISERILIRFERIIEERITRYPLQYILGEAWFYGRKFMVTPDVMVPTPETEILCELAINYIRNEGIKRPRIVDVGTGSGVIAVTVAAEIESASVRAVDISRKALNIAQKNARMNEVEGKIDFMISDFLTGLPEDKKYHLILSNPPYISEKEYKTLPPEVLADPKNSLVSGRDGLDFIKRLLKEAPEYLKEKGRLMFEIGYNQAEQVSRLSEKDHRYESFTVVKDLNDIDRVVILGVGQ